MQGYSIQGQHTEINQISSNKQLETEFQKAIHLIPQKHIYISIKIYTGSICWKWKNADERNQGRPK